MKQQMGDLPAPRVNAVRAFINCGVDYAGPFMLKAIPAKSKITFKAYIALFVCFVTKAVHLGIVSSLSTEAFLAALKRFVARRGKPSNVYSDCGTNFVGAAKELKELSALLKSQQHSSQIANQLSSDNIQWHFNPPSAPLFGGLWEAGVKSVKFHLSRIVGGVRLSFEEMSTVVTQIESCLNSRPLTPLSSDPNDLAALTPGHFLIGDSLKAVPEPTLTDLQVNRLSRWQMIQQVQHFWNRWRNEFLTRLQQRPKWLSPLPNMKVNDLVIIKDDNFSSNNWPLARVLELHPGDDGNVRVVTLKTTHGELKRPISKLCCLPVESS